ncbi:TetR/AcrR family transcriptional regulator [Corynebacterium tapiri]|uniref:TetR family transcriptional regulator n=1 Tax=Corynebacterium tapiri TaxID=1448266 RepID=A0A5C4U2G2_9CORY|nr:TetR family transcriptional regulator [Corynebacterium tapiri]TNL96648.1 TetR family transcriptional regulator [Corynebacterium tapiri]
MGGRVQQRRSQLKKQAILDAAIDLMFEFGLQGVTHRQVATRAAVPVGSIGYYFHTRDELLVHAVTAMGQRRAAHVAELNDDLAYLAGASNEHVASAILDLIIPDPQFWLTGWVGVSMDCTRESATLRECMSTIRNEQLEDIGQALQAAQRDIDPAIVVLVVDGCVVRAVGVDAQATYQDTHDTLVDLLSMGVARRTEPVSS